MINDIIFNLGFALLLTHELDAIKRKEWRIFPLIKNFEEDFGYKLFVLFHIPLIFILLWLNLNLVEELKFWFRICFDAFLIIHLGLHILFRNAEKNEFNNGFSKFLISITALIGFAHLFLILGFGNI